MLTKGALRILATAAFMLVLVVLVNDARASVIGPLLADDLVVATGVVPNAPAAAEVAFDGSRYLIVWEADSIFGRFVTTSGAFSGGAFTIAAPRFPGVGQLASAAVAFNGVNYLVVWVDSGNKIRGRVLSPDGLLLGSELVIADAENTRSAPKVASDGSRFLVVWDDFRSFAINGGDIFGQFVVVDTAGLATLQGVNFRISPAEQHQFGASVAFGATTFLVTWTNDITPNAGQRDVFGALVSSSGAVSEPIAISAALGPQQQASISFGGSAFLVVFLDVSRNSVVGARLTESGVLLDGPASAGGIVIFPSVLCSSLEPRAAFSGTEWLVVWGCQTRGSRVSTGGDVLDPGGVPLFVTPMSFQDRPAVAFDGTNYLVTWGTVPESTPLPSSRFAQLVGRSNRPPLANAGPDQTVNEGALVTLDGSGSSDPDGDPLTFQWTQLAGPAVSLSNPTAAKPTFVAPSVPVGGATLTFQLTVSDGQLTSTDTINVTVKNVNHPPVANAGGHQTVAEGALVTLDGSASFDSDGEPLTFSWSQTAGPSVSLSNPAAAKSTFIAPVVGPSGATLTFALTVRDGIDSASDTVNVVVENVNHAPVANAGGDQTKDEGSVVMLDGNASSDPDEDPLTFTWTQLTGPMVTLSNPTSPTPTFTAPLVGPGGEKLVFQLTVADGFGGTASDTVAITVVNINDPPACGLAQASPALLWPPNHKMVPVGIVGVTDPNNDQVTITVTGVTQDEPVNGLGDGDTSPDAVLQGAHVLLRMERSGTGNGRVYRVSFTADDGASGQCTGSVTVCVPHSRQPGTCVDSGQLYNSLQP